MEDEDGFVMLESSSDGELIDSNGNQIELQFEKQVQHQEDEVYGNLSKEMKLNEGSKENGGNKAVEMEVLQGSVENSNKGESSEGNCDKNGDEVPPNPSNIIRKENDEDIYQKDRSFLVSGPDAAISVQKGIWSVLVKLPSLLLKWTGRGVLSGIDEAFQAIFGSNTVLNVVGGSALAALIDISYNLGCYLWGSKTWESSKKDVIDGTSGIFIGNTAAALLMANFEGSLLSLIPFGLGATAWAPFLLQFAIGAIISWKVRDFVGKFTEKYYDLCKDEDLNICLKKLGLTRKATEMEVDSACRQLSAELHPDALNKRDPPPTPEEIEKAVEEFIEIQKARKYIKTAMKFEKTAESKSERKNWRHKLWENYVLFWKNLFSLKRKEYLGLEGLQTMEVNLEETFLPEMEGYQEVRISETQQGEVFISWWKHFWHLFEKSFTKLDLKSDETDKKEE